MMASVEDEALTGLWFVGQKHPPRTGEWIPVEENSLFRDLQAWLGEYFAGRNLHFSLRIDPRGTDFQRSVWDMLLAIPYGGLSTYGAIAERIALKRKRPVMSARAVGGAVGRNPLSIVIPCHRVVGSRGCLTGYAGGVYRKKALLELEGTYLVSSLRSNRA
jgi:methylated-DNA-[protein]-cysteine S-methyltransferase